MVRELHWRSMNPQALIGVVAIEHVQVGPSSAELQAALRGPWPQEAALEPRDAGIRALLRTGGFKPTGRNKPAHEFLIRAGDGLMSICNVVDVNNIMSIRHRLPASVIDSGICNGGIVIREGLPGEQYVFNRSGQQLDLEGLLVVCDAAGMPIASPVKDSLRAHVGATTRGILACVYGSVELLSAHEMERILRNFTDLLISAAGGHVRSGWIATSVTQEAFGRPQ